jgi:hypothetical protein
MLVQEADSQNSSDPNEPPKYPSGPDYLWLQPNVSAFGGLRTLQISILASGS